MNSKNLALSRFAGRTCLLVSTMLLATWLPAQTIKSMSVNPKTVGALINSAGSVTLSAPAPTGGAVVTLSSSNVSVAQVPAQVTVPQGKSAAGFTITTGRVVTPFKVTISGTYKTSKGKAMLTVQGPEVSTTAGGFTGDGAAATKACLMFPQFGGLDASGNIYIADDFDNRIRMYNAKTKVITTVAGYGHVGYNGEGITATKATMSGPRSAIVFDSAGDFYYTDDGNNRIRAVVGGVVNTIIGTGTAGYTGDGQGTAIDINQPTGLVLDGSGNLYFADTNNQIIRVWNPTTKAVTTIAGTPQTSGHAGDGGAPLSAELNSPRGLAFDSTGNLYIADNGNFEVRIIAGLGGGSPTINTIAGSWQKPGFSGDGGPATDAAIGLPRGVLVNNGNLYISNAGRIRVRFVNLTSGVIDTYAGEFYGYDGGNNPPLDSQFETPTGIFFDSNGNLDVIDAGQSRVRDVLSGTVPTLIGGYSGDGGIGTNGCLIGPENVSFDNKGGYYVVEANGNHVRYVNSKGDITTTVDTNGVFGYSGDGGNATAATIESPMGVAADTNGNVYVADNINNVIRVVSGKIISTFDADPTFVNITSLTTDSSGDVYSVDSGDGTSGCVVREITPGGTSSIIAGTGTCGYSGDGGPATSAQLSAPYGIALDKSGNIYIADANNCRIRIISSGTINTFAGNGTCSYKGDGGPATSAELNNPMGVVADPYGHVFIADYNNDYIRVVINGTINHYLGSSTLHGYDGEKAGQDYVGIGGPVSIGIGPRNTLFYVDDVEYRVRKVE